MCWIRIPRSANMFGSNFRGFLLRHEFSPYVYVHILRLHFGKSADQIQWFVLPENGDGLSLSGRHQDCGHQHLSQVLVNHHGSQDVAVGISESRGAHSYFGTLHEHTRGHYHQGRYVAGSFAQGRTQVRSQGKGGAAGKNAGKILPYSVI